MAKHLRKSHSLRLSPQLKQKEQQEQRAASFAWDEAMARDRKSGYHAVKLVLFFAVMAVISLLVWIPSLRPAHSDLENRDLATFPEFSGEALANGTYFDQIGVWFSDTFPAREALIEGRSRWETLYGVRSVKLYGSVGSVGDDIPDVPDEPSTPGLPSLPPVPDGPPVPSTGPTHPTGPTVSTDSTHPTHPTVPTAPTAPTAPTTPLPTRPPQAGGQITELDSVLVVGNSAYEYYNFSQAVADDYAACVSHAAASLSGQAHVYDMVIPTSVDVMLSPEVRSRINCSDQKRAIDYIYSKLSGAYPIPIQDVLRSHNNEYLYFSTDHHWTSLGAYYAYRQFMTMKGIAPHALSDYEPVVFDGFLGSFYSKTQDAGLKTNEDTVYAYYPIADASLYFEDSNGVRTNWQIITNVTNWSARYKYNTFIGGDNAYTRIDNPSLSDNSAIVVIKESFGNAFVPFLVDHYQTVHVVDYRYYEAMSLQQLVQATGAREVLFINNVSATRNAELVGCIGDLVSR